jgi:type IV secretion system protein TrbL
LASAALRGMQAGIGGAVGAVGSAAKEKAIGSPGAYAGSMLGLANAKLDQQSSRPGTPPPPPPINDSK